MFFGVLGFSALGFGGFGVHLGVDFGVLMVLGFPAFSMVGLGHFGASFGDPTSPTWSFFGDPRGSGVSFGLSSGVPDSHSGGFWGQGTLGSPSL